MNSRFVTGVKIGFEDIKKYYLGQVLGEIMVVRLSDGRGAIVSTYDHVIIEYPTKDINKLANQIGLYSDETTTEMDRFYAESVIEG